MNAPTTETLSVDCRTGNSISAGKDLARADAAAFDSGVADEERLPAGSESPVRVHRRLGRSRLQGADHRGRQALSYTWDAMGLENVVTWILSPSGAGRCCAWSKRRPHQPAAACSGSRWGWQNMFASLEQTLAKYSRLRTTRIMKETTLRAIIRWNFIFFCAIPIIGYIYSPFEVIPDYAGADPVRVLSGHAVVQGSGCGRAISFDGWLNRGMGG